MNQEALHLQSHGRQDHSKHLSERMQAAMQQNNNSVKWQPSSSPVAHACLALCWSSDISTL